MDTRIVLFQDAIRVIKDYPLLGTGGGGWAAVYKSYQDYYYNSRQVHNQYLQVWVEAGVFGFLAFLGIWVSFILAFILNCIKGRAEQDLWQLWVVVLLPSIALGLHSIIDWNFAMASVGYYLFVLIGAGMSLDRVNWFGKNDLPQKSAKRGGLILGLSAVLLGLLLLLYTTGLLMGLHATWRSQELANRNNIKGAIVEIEKAIRLDPLRAENYHNLNVVLEEQYRRTGSPDLLQKILYLAMRAYELEPYNINYANRYGQLLLFHVDIDEGLSMLDRSLMINPFNADNYINSALSRLSLAEFFIQNGFVIEANQLLVGIWRINDAMAERNIINRDILFILGRAGQLSGDNLTAIHYYQQVDENDRFYNEAKMFLDELSH